MRQILALAVLMSVLLAQGCHKKPSSSVTAKRKPAKAPASVVTTSVSTPAADVTRPADLPSVTHAAHNARGRYYDQPREFSFVPPAGWTRGPSISPAFVSFLGPATRQFRTNVNINVVADDGMPMDRIGAAIKPQMPKHFAGWKPVHDSVVDIHGRPAYFLSSRYRRDRLDLHMLQYLLRDNAGHLFTVTFTTLESEFPRLKGTFERSAMSVLCGR